MKILLFLLIPLVTADLYKETQNFQYSRSSSDDGEKKGFYEAQSGNMGGNYEVAKNMDRMAQTQMKGLMEQVGSQLGIDHHAIGTGSAQHLGSGSVYGSASTSGNTYGRKGMSSTMGGSESDGYGATRNQHSGSRTYDDSQRQYSSNYGSRASDHRMTAAQGSTMEGSDYEDSQRSYGRVGTLSHSGTRQVEDSHLSAGASRTSYVDKGSRYQTASNANRNDRTYQYGETGALTGDLYRPTVYVPVSRVNEEATDSVAAGSRYSGSSVRQKSSMTSEYEQAQTGFGSESTQNTGSTVVRPVYVRPGSTVRLTVRPHQVVPIQIPVTAARVKPVYIQNVDETELRSTGRVDSDSQIRLTNSEQTASYGAASNTHDQSVAANRLRTYGTTSNVHGQSIAADRLRTTGGTESQSSYSTQNEWERNRGRDVIIQPTTGIHNQELITDTGSQVTDTQTGGRNRYHQTSYSLDKNWEKHGTSREIIQPTVGVTNAGAVRDLGTAAANRNTFVTGTLDLGTEGQGSTVYNSGSRVATTGRRYGSGSVQGTRGESQSTRYRTDSSNQGQTYDAASEMQRSNLDGNDRLTVTDTKPKSYQSSYSYHKAWERHGTPYVIEPGSHGTLEVDSQVRGGSNDNAETREMSHSTSQAQRSQYESNARLASSSHNSGAQYGNAYDASHAASGASHSDTLTADMAALQARLRNQMSQLCTDCGTGKTKGYSASYSYSAQRSYGGHDQETGNGENEGQRRLKREAYHPAVEAYNEYDQQIEDLGQKTEDMEQKTYDWDQQMENMKDAKDREDTFHNLGKKTEEFQFESGFQGNNPRYGLNRQNRLQTLNHQSSLNGHITTDDTSNMQPKRIYSIHQKGETEYTGQMTYDLGQPIQELDQESLNYNQQSYYNPEQSLLQVGSQRHKKIDYDTRNQGTLQYSSTNLNPKDTEIQNKERDNILEYVLSHSKKEEKPTAEILLASPQHTTDKFVGQDYRTSQFSFDNKYSMNEKQKDGKSNDFNKQSNVNYTTEEVIKVLDELEKQLDDLFKEMHLTKEQNDQMKNFDQFSNPKEKTEEMDNLGQQTEDLGQFTLDFEQQTQNFNQHSDLGQKTEDFSQSEAYHQNYQGASLQLGSSIQQNEKDKQKIHTNPFLTQNIEQNIESGVQIGNVLQENEYFGEKAMQNQYGHQDIDLPHSSIYVDQKAKELSHKSQSTLNDENFGNNININQDNMGREHKFSPENKNESEDKIGTHDMNPNVDRHLADILSTVGNGHFVHTTHSKMEKISEHTPKDNVYEFHKKENTDKSGTDMKVDENFGDFTKDNNFDQNQNTNWDQTLEVLPKKPHFQLEVASQIKPISEDKDSGHGSELQEKSFLDVYATEPSLDDDHYEQTNQNNDDGGQQLVQGFDEQLFEQQNVQTGFDDGGQQTVQIGFDDGGQQTVQIGLNEQLSRNVDGQIHQEPVDEKKLTGTLTQQSLKETVIIETPTTTESPGFWKKIGSGIGKAKDKAKSWFG